MELIHWVAVVIILIIGFILAALFLTGFLGQGLEHGLNFLKVPI